MNATKDSNHDDEEDENDERGGNNADDDDDNNEERGRDKHVVNGLECCFARFANVCVRTAHMCVFKLI